MDGLRAPVCSLADIGGHQSRYEMLHPRRCPMGCRMFHQPLSGPLHEQNIMPVQRTGSAGTC